MENTVVLVAVKGFLLELVDVARLITESEPVATFKGIDENIGIIHHQHIRTLVFFVVHDQQYRQHDKCSH